MGTLPSGPGAQWGTVGGLGGPGPEEANRKLFNQHRDHVPVFEAPPALTPCDQGVAVWPTARTAKTGRAGHFLKPPEASLTGRTSGFPLGSPPSFDGCNVRLVLDFRCVRHHKTADRGKTLGSCLNRCGISQPDRPAGCVFGLETVPLCPRQTPVGP